VPLLDPAVPLLEAKIKAAVGEHTNAAGIRWQDLLTESANWITDFLRWKLGCGVGSTTHLNFIAKALALWTPSQMAILTTNHDRVLETYFERDSRKLNDGFVSIPGTDHPVWEPSTFEDRAGDLMLFKLHGSVDWFRVNRTDGLWDGVIRGYRGPAMDIPGIGQVTCAPERPLMLIGTHNKREEYTFDIFAELYCRARRAIMNCTNLLVCGYGFGDRGINQMIWDWAGHALSRGEKRRLIVAHGDFDKLTRQVNPGVVRVLHKLQTARFLVRINGWVEGLNWESVRPLLV
jgi:hypothetical protein